MEKVEKMPQMENHNLFIVVTLFKLQFLNRFLAGTWHYEPSFSLVNRVRFT